MPGNWQYLRPVYPHSINMKARLLFFLIIPFLIHSVTSIAATRTWTGAISTAWAVPGNWVGGVPLAADQADIPGSLISGNYPLVTTAITITTLNVNTAGANATLTISGGGSLTVSGVSTVLATGTLIQSGGAMVFNGALTVNGTFTQNSGTATLNNVTTITVAVGGSFNSVAGTVIFNGTTTLSCPNSNFSFYNITIPATRTLIQNNVPVLYVKGDWNHSGTFTNSSRAVELRGTTSIQTISGSANLTFFNLTVNNTFVPLPTWDPVIFVNKRIFITNALTLTWGIVKTASQAEDVFMNAGSSSTGGHDNSFIDGPMSKDGNSIFIYPTGDQGKWARFKINPAGASTFQVEYHYAPYNAGTPVWNPITDVSIVEHWMCWRTSGSANAKISLYWEDALYSGINDCVDLTIGSWDITNYWIEESSTADPGSNCSGLGEGAITTNTNCSTFDKAYTFASKIIGPINVNPLPIELLSFSAELQERNVVLEWVTATEINNSYFTVQRTRDGIQYTDIGNLAGHGTTSQTHSYSLTDQDPVPGIAYYRLKQTDLDSSVSFSAQVAVHYTELETSCFTILDNPVAKSKSIYIVYANFSISPDLRVHTSAGDLIHEEHLQTGENAICKLQNLKINAAGIYFLTLSSGAKSITKKLVIY